MLPSPPTINLFLSWAAEWEQSQVLFPISARELNIVQLINFERLSKFNSKIWHLDIYFKKFAGFQYPLNHLKYNSVSIVATAASEWN